MAETQEQHYTPHEWTRFGRRMIDPADARRMAQHLDECETCFRTFSGLIPPPYYLCGRPMPTLTPIPTPFLDRQADKLIALCERSWQAGGGTIVAASASAREPIFYSILSRTYGRLRRGGKKAALCGSPFEASVAPKRPNVEIAILLEAPSFSNVREWHGGIGKASLLCGSINDLANAGLSDPDFVLNESDFEVGPELLRSHEESTFAMFMAASERIAVAYALCAVGCDVPASFFDVGDIPSEFAAVEKINENKMSDWYSTPGQWLVRSALLGHWPEVRSRIKPSALALLPKSTQERFAARIAALRIPF